MTIDWSKFEKATGPEVLNVKVADLLKAGIYPAFHMNKNIG